ncbi:MAG TPA: cobalt-precorrin-5B (C(1))-methyltransferase CbiD [Verrucomicrobiae bacterium]|nr:cobalt-precorrin-5B (C(1))-methyltransferase CbiD [Verrucomicrobiae bacterium]
MQSRRLRPGYTTGACAAAAARGAARMLREQRLVEEIPLVLPGGEAVFRLHGQSYDDTTASCYVVKDAGDDPDVTHGAEIHATVRRQGLRQPATSMVFVLGGEGVGRVTKPGLAVPVGEPAINPVPLRMIRESVAVEFAVACLPQALYVTISVPAGEELAKKTLNARLGIVGGISILGTTGIVRPLSAEAWTATIDSAIDVALACGAETVVLSTGRTSEAAAQRFLGTGDRGPGTGGEEAGTSDRGPGTGGQAKGVTSASERHHSVEDIGSRIADDTRILPVPGPRSPIPGLPEEAFIMMGDHVAYALNACAAKGVRRVVLAAQFAKLLKIAVGHPNTHAASAELDLRSLREWVAASPAASLLPLLQGANTARQVLEESGRDPLLLELVAGRVRVRMAAVLPSAEIQVFVAGYDGGVLYFA